MRAQRISWISQPFTDKRWPQWTYWEYRLKNDNLTFTMGITEHDVYMADKAILDFLESDFHDDIPTLLELIDAYGDARYNSGRQSEVENHEG